MSKTEKIECKKCKTVNSTESNYCKNCGEDLTLQIKEAAPNIEPQLLNEDGC